MKLLRKLNLYYYNEDNIKYKPLPLRSYLAGILLTFLLSISISYFLGRQTQIIQLNEWETKILLSHIKDTTNKFSPEKLQSLLVELKIKYPYIVYAQSLLETGNFHSDIFLENHNLFGMKQARVRVNTAKGTFNGHAYYHTWQESVFDYAFYQCRYLYQIESEENYFIYLGERYAEDPNYIFKLKQIVEDEELKKLFNVSN